MILYFEILILLNSKIKSIMDGSQYNEVLNRKTAAGGWKIIFRLWLTCVAFQYDLCEGSSPEMSVLDRRGIMRAFFDALTRDRILDYTPSNAGIEAELGFYVDHARKLTEKDIFEIFGKNFAMAPRAFEEIDLKCLEMMLEETSVPKKKFKPKPFHQSPGTAAYSYLQLENSEPSG